MTCGISGCRIDVQVKSCFCEIHKFLRSSFSKVLYLGTSGMNTLSTIQIKLYNLLEERFGVTHPASTLKMSLDTYIDELTELISSRLYTQYCNKSVFLDAWYDTTFLALTYAQTFKVCQHLNHRVDWNEKQLQTTEIKFNMRLHHEQRV